MENNKNYMKGFVPYAIAAAILLSHGFVPESLDRRMYSWKTTKII